VDSIKDLGSEDNQCRQLKERKKASMPKLTKTDWQQMTIHKDVYNNVNIINV